MFSFNCCFLTCIQVSQDAGQVVWYSHLLKNFPQFVVVHTVKGLTIVNETEVDFFGGNSLAFSMIQQMLAIWSLIPMPFLNPAWTFGNSHFTHCWSPTWRILSIILLACEMSAIMQKFEHFCHYLSLGLEWKLTFFQSWGHCWVFEIWWIIECNTFFVVVVIVFFFF